MDDFTTLTISLLALVGMVMVLAGIWLLVVGKVDLPGTPSEPVLEAEVPNFFTVKTRMPALGLMVLGMISILGATQLARQMREADLEQERQQRLEVSGHVRALDVSSVPGARLTLLTKHADLNPFDDGSVRTYMWTGSRLLELRIRSAGRTKPEATIPVELSPIDGSLRLPEIDLDEMLGKIAVEKPGPTATPMTPLPDRTATPSFGSEKP